MSYFQTKTRDNGETFVCMSDDAPEWVIDAVMEAHDDELPNDWRYETCAAIFANLEGYDPDDEDAAHEIADGLVDIYNGPRFRWAADYAGRHEYADEFEDDGGTIVDRLGTAQYVAIRQMVDIIRQAILENADR